MTALDKYSFAATTVSSMSVFEKQGGKLVLWFSYLISVFGSLFLSIMVFRRLVNIQCHRIVTNQVLHGFCLNLTA